MLRTRYIIFSLTLLIALNLSALSANAQKNVREVQIKSHWGGLGAPQVSDLLIREQNGSFLLNGKIVDNVLVEALVTALTEPAMPRPDLLNLGITPEWLKANAVPAAVKRAANFADAAPNQKELFIRSFTDLAVIGRVVPTLFAFTSFDDYPSAMVTVTFEDGSKISAESDASYKFMLPWKLSSNNETTYNANLSRALAVLMPEKTTNRERLAGEGLDADLADVVMRFVDRDWNLLDAENRAGKALATLRDAYTVESAEINSYHHPEYGLEWEGNRRREINLHATLRKSTFSPNVVDALVLQYQNGRVEGVEKFLGTAGKYESLAFSVSWLNDYIRQHPEIPIRISYVHDASFGDRAMKVFAADMQAIGKAQLALDVRAIRSQIALVIAGRTYAESYWLIFPDKRMLLWRYGGPSGLLKWSPEDFPMGRCSAYHSVIGGCAGVMVSPDGMLTDHDRDRQQSLEACVASGRRNPVPTRPDILFPVHRSGRGGFIDRTGELIIPLCFDTVGHFSEGLARFERDGRWGFINESGTVVIPPQFSWAWEFSEGLARVQPAGQAFRINSRWGFIDKTGKLVIKPEYEELEAVDEEDQGFRNGLAMIQVDGKKGFIDRAGQLVIRPQFQYAYHFSEGLASVLSTDNEKWGYIDGLGRWAIPPQFESASAFSENLAPVNRTRSCGYIDRSGKFVLEPAVSRAETDCAVVWGHFTDGLSRWKISDKYGYIDRSGKIIIEPRFDLTYQFSEGLAAVLIGDRWGYIDHTGRMVIQPVKLNRAEGFHNGLAYVVTTDGKHGYIDRSGKYVWKPALQDN